MTEVNTGPASTTEKVIPPMHDAYHKARKLFIFFSLLLLSNELTGVLGVDIKEILKDVNFFGIKIGEKSLENPVVLVAGYLILWGYSAIRYFIEWFQVDLDRRKGRASKWDLWVTLSVAITAGIIWVTQQITEVQVAKVPLEFLLPFFVGLIVPLILNFKERSKQDKFGEKQKKRYKITFIVLFIIVPVLTLIYLILFFDKILSLIAILSLIGAFIIGMLKNALDGITPFSPSPTTKLDKTGDAH
jgi:uncharacterized Tic20 family protein